LFHAETVVALCEGLGVQAPAMVESVTRKRKFQARVRVHKGEIIRDIQNPANQGSIFVLPSQLNGAEYPSYRSVVARVAEYRWDNTGGPRGQLACHPAAAQFVLDNASTEADVTDSALGGSCGLTAVDQLLGKSRVNGRAAGRKQAMWLQNGYLNVPKGLQAGDKAEVLRQVQEWYATVRILCTMGLPASGLDPTLSAASPVAHRVSLVYASAVPVSTYNNPASDAGEEAFQRKVGKQLLIAQYFGAMLQAWKEVQAGKDRQAVFLMPLGGGVFNNHVADIADAVACAVQMLEAVAPKEVLGKLDLVMLCFEKSREDLYFCKEFAAKGLLRTADEEPEVTTPLKRKPTAPAADTMSPAAKAPQRGPAAVRSLTTGSTADTTASPAKRIRLTRRESIDLD